MKLPFFFKKKKSITISKIFPKIKNNIKINNITTLSNANKFDLTFFDNVKYKDTEVFTNLTKIFCSEYKGFFLYN